MKLKLLVAFLFFTITRISVKTQATITINSFIHYQTIEGWGHGGGVLGGTYGAFSMLDSSVANPLNYEYLDYLVNDLGLTGSRLTEVGPRTVLVWIMEIVIQLTGQNFSQIVYRVPKRVI